jgi:hypothetical protein
MLGDWVGNPLKINKPIKSLLSFFKNHLIGGGMW